jgi:hypothetical protein
MNDKIRLNKEYIKGLGFALTGIVIIHPFFWFSSDSRDEILSVFFCSIFSFVLVIIFNLIYLVPIKRLEIRLLLPGIMTIMTPILLWKNNDVSINQYILIGIINLLIGIGFYIQKLTNK